MSSQSPDVVVIPDEVCGFSGVAFGGYVAGVLAARTGAGAAQPVRVDFRRPVPPGSRLRVRWAPDGERQLTDSAGLLHACARPGELKVDVPDAPSWAEAVAASQTYRAAAPADGIDCFGCGLERPTGRGLRQFPAPVPGRELVAAAWEPATQLAGEDGTLPGELVWAALDCPGGWAVRSLGPATGQAITAHLTGTVLRDVHVGQPHLVYAWLVSSAGRKHVAGTAVATLEGELCAVAEALWVDPRS